MAATQSRDACNASGGGGGGSRRRRKASSGKNLRRKPERCIYAAECHLATSRRVTLPAHRARRAHHAGRSCPDLQ